MAFPSSDIPPNKGFIYGYDIDALPLIHYRKKLVLVTAPTRLYFSWDIMSYI